MTLTDSIEIDADATAVWPLIADPTWHRRWNSKARDVSREHVGNVSPGERFEMTYVMSGRARRSEVKAIDVQPGERVTYLHRVSDGRRVQLVEERYEIERCGNGVRLTQAIEMSDAGIPWLLRPLIWLVHRFGETAGKAPLEELKRLAELDGDSRD